ncbi:MAG TPA: PKD domain-containing protein [Flavobacteriales bacterium]|nr:PKD domain-containing protein [Flavobacteriales bacterium]
MTWQLRHSVLLYIAALLQLTASGQTFYKTFGSSNQNETAQCVEQLTDGNFAIGGSKGDSALVMKVDPFGNVLWTRCFKPVQGLNNLIYQLAATPDGYLIGTGSASPLGILYNKTFLFKFDLAGNLIWQSHSSGLSPIWTHRIVPMSSTQYMAMTEVYDVNSPTWSDPFTSLINASTGLVDYNNPRLNFFTSTPYIDDINAAALSPSSAVYGYGRTYVSGSSAGSMRPFITKYDQTGQHLWTRYLMFPATQSARIYGSDITYADDSLITCYTGSISGTGTNFSVGMIRTDTSGNAAWIKDYKLQGYSAANSFTVLRMPYGFAITGYCTNSGNHSDLFVIATDRTGEILWARTYGSATISSDLPVSFTSQSVAVGNDILFTGTAHFPGNTNIILARVDGSGDISCGTSTPVNITVTTIPPFSSEITPTQIPFQLTLTAPAPATASYILEDICATVQIDLGPDTASCGPVTLDATVASGSYLWSTGSTDPSITVTGQQIVWVEVTVDCCTYADTVIISAGTPSTPSFNFSSSPCDLTVTTVNSSTGASSYEWDFGDGETSSDAQPTHTYGVVGSYDVTLTAINGCGMNDTTIQLILHPAGTFSIAGPDSLCAGQEGTYTSLLIDGSLSSIVWSSGANSDTIQFGSASSGMLYATATDSNNCMYSDTLSLHIDPVPQAAFTFTSASCDSIVTFTDASIHASTWQWDLGNGMSSGIPSPTGYYPTTGIFTVEQIVSNTCGSDTASHELTLGPSGDLALIGADSMCSGQTEVYSILLQGTGVSTVSWSLASGDSTSIPLSLSNSNTLVVTVLGTDGCTYMDTLAIQVDPIPSAAFTVHLNPCDSTASFANTSLFANSYSWDFGNGETSTSVSPIVHFAPMSYDITLIASNACGVDIEQQNISFDPVLPIQLVGPSIICSDKPVTFHIAYAGTGLHDIHWSTGDTTASITTSTLDGDSIHVTALDNNGCPLQSSFLVSHTGMGGLGTAYVPNVFSPNKDGINDYFAAVIPDGFVSMTIFNRWGNEIYETTDINKPWRGDFKGSPVPDGTYVYIVKWNDKCTNTPASITGHVTLLR